MLPYQENLGRGLILRTVRDERDIDRYAAFNTAVVNEVQGMTCARLLRHHPEIAYDDFLLVEDECTGKVVSTIGLIPWHCRYEGIELDVAMLEMVATHPEYRHQRLVRAQIKRFHEIVKERHFDLSIIEGIPFYYRQYGYAYAIDHWAYDSLQCWRIPDRQDGQENPFRLRRATLDDVEALTRHYRDSMAGLGLCALRAPGYWRFLLQRAQFPVQLVEDRAGHSVGYVAVSPLPNKRGAKVLESGITNHAVGMAVLRQLKLEEGGEIQLGWPQTSTLVQIGRSLGSVSLPTYQWLLRISDIAGFLAKIGPVLESRLASSDCAGLTADLCINLFREAFVLSFEAGKLLGVESAGFVDSSMGADGGDLCIPPEAFVRLILGYRGLNELRDAWPDIVVKAESCRFLDVLFPRMTSHFCMPYLYCGPTASPSPSQ